MLVELGFEEPLAKAALIKFGGNVERAAEYLLTRAEDHSPRVPVSHVVHDVYDESRLGGSVPTVGGNTNDGENYSSSISRPNSLRIPLEASRHETVDEHRDQISGYAPDTDGDELVSSHLDEGNLAWHNSNSGAASRGRTKFRQARYDSPGVSAPEKVDVDVLGTHYSDADMLPLSNMSLRPSSPDEGDGCPCSTFHYDQVGEQKEFILNNNTIKASALLVSWEASRGSPIGLLLLDVNGDRHALAIPADVIACHEEGLAYILSRLEYNLCEQREDGPSVFELPTVGRAVNCGAGEDIEECLRLAYTVVPLTQRLGALATSGETPRADIVGESSTQVNEASASETEISDSVVDQLVAMGFSKDDVRSAVIQANNNLEQALVVLGCS